MKNLKKQQKCTMYNVQCTTNDERHRITMQPAVARYDRLNGNDENRSSLRADEVGVAIRRRCRSSVIPHFDAVFRRSAFTLIELVITIAIVIILSVISVPIYQGYTRKAKMAEGYALLGTILSAQKAYYSEYGNFLQHADSDKYTSFDTVLGIDARGNKYFTYFHAGEWSGGNTFFDARVWTPEELRQNGKTSLNIFYNITRGVTINEA